MYRYIQSFFTTAQVGGERGTAGTEVERLRIEAPRGWGVGRGCDFGSQYGEFWCILDGIFYSSAT